MNEGGRKLIVVALGIGSYTTIALVLGIEAAQTALPAIITLVGLFVGANMVEHKMKKKEVT